MKDTDFSKIYDAQVLTFDEALSMVPKDNIKSFDQSSISGPITTPHLLIEAVEMEIDQDAKGSGGLMWVKVQYQAHCILSRTIDKVDIECLNFASLVIKTVNNNRWGLKNVGVPEQVTAFPGRYTNDPKGFDSWIVSWWQTVAIGESWQLSQFSPDTVLISEAPEIGAEHKDDYEELTDGFIDTAEN